MIDDGEPLRRAHAGFVVRLASAVLAGYALVLLDLGYGWVPVLLAVAAWIAPAAWSGSFGTPWAHRVAENAPVRAARATAVDDVRPVTRDDLRVPRAAGAARVAAGLTAFVLAGLAREAADVHRLSTLLGFAGFVGGWMVIGGVGALWTLRRLGRTPLGAVPVTVAAVGRPSSDRVLLVGPSLAWTADRQRVLAGVVTGDVVVAHLDPASGDPAFVTDGTRRSVVDGVLAATPAEVDRLLAPPVRSSAPDGRDDR